MSIVYDEIDYKCCICMEIPIIPVEIICFPCYKNNLLNCNSLLRICLQCCILFFQLNRHKNMREYNKKCFYCPCHIRLASLSFHNTFKFDFRFHSSTIIHSCPFCNHFVGNTIQLISHLKICDEYFIECQCNQIIIFKNYYLHKKSCLFFDQCHFCNDLIENTHINQHMRDSHDHIICHQCNMFILFKDFQIHSEKYCQYRTIMCNICLQNLKFLEYERHLLIHKNTFIDELKKLEIQVNNFTNRLEEVNILLKPFTRFQLMN